MRVDLEPERRAEQRSWRGAARVFSAPGFLLLMGCALAALAATQPAWIDGRIGPGLMAQGVAGLVIVLSVIWGVALAVERRMGAIDGPRGDAAGEARPRRRSLAIGLAVLGSLAAFAVAFDTLGLVFACALTAAIASWGAGDRTPPAMAPSAAAAALIAYAVGATLLPPTIGLWPWSPF